MNEQTSLFEAFNDFCKSLGKFILETNDEFIKIGQAVSKTISEVTKNLPKMENVLNNFLIPLYEFVESFSFESEKISSIEDFDKIMQEGCYYRGQANSEWAFIPKLFRNINEIKKGIAEMSISSEMMISLSKEKSVFKLNVQKLACEVLDIARIQHQDESNPNGTFLLDITTDVFVALYFATKDFTGENNVSIFRIKPLKKESIITDLKKANEYILNQNFYLLNGDAEEISERDIKELIPEGETLNPYGKILDFSDEVDRKNIPNLFLQKGAFFSYGSFCIGLDRNFFVKKHIKEDFEIIKYDIDRKIVIELIDKRLNKEKYNESTLFSKEV